MAASVIVQDTEDEQQYQEALAICSLYALLDQSIRYALHNVFGPSNDKRVKRGGHIFLARLLRFGTLVQDSLFPGTEICDYARIVIPNILVFTRDPSWPWCYDTTLKYLNLLVAAGILITKPDERGIYYLPMGPYVLLQEHAKQQIEHLAHKRTKISRSAAYIRTVQHCLTPPNAVLPEFAGTAISLDEQGMQQALSAIAAVLQRQQGVSLLPKTMSEITSVLAAYIPQASHKKRTPFLPLPVLSHRSGPGGEREHGKETQNLPRQESESTTRQESQPDGDEIVDSSHISFTESLVSLKLKENLLSDTSEFTINGIRRSTLNAESAFSHQLADSSSEQQKRDFTDEEIEVWARELSRLVNGNHAKVGHYRTLLHQSPVVLHIAIVDALVRSVFPDPGRKVDKLGGGWIMRCFKVYLEGSEEVPPEIYAWSQTGLPYEEIAYLLDAEAAYQDLEGQKRRRPFPDEIHEVIASTALHSFWRHGGAYGLEEAGYRYVEVNGELLTCEQYEDLRKRALHATLHTMSVISPQGDTEAQEVLPTCQLDTDVEEELQAYVEWCQSLLESPEEVERLLEQLSPRFVQGLMSNVERLQLALDDDQYEVEVVVLPPRKKHETPIQKRLIIEVRKKHSPMEAWLLTKEQEIDYFLTHLDRFLDGTEQTLSATMRLLRRCRAQGRCERADAKLACKQSA